MDIRASVKVIKDDHPRTGEAGYIVAIDNQAGTADVQLDLDPRGHLQAIQLADLHQLGMN